MKIDSSMIVAIVVLVLFGLVYFFLFVGMYKARKKTLFARLEDDGIEQEIRDNYTEFQTDYENLTFEEFLERGERKTKRANVISGIFCVLISLICIAVSTFSLVARSNDDQLFFGNTAILVVRTGSMQEQNKYNAYLFENDLTDQIQANEMIAITTDYDQLELYDIVAFKGEEGETVVHRLIRINVNEDGTKTFSFRGDTNAASFDWETNVTPDRIIGVDTGFRNLFLGQFVVYLQSSIGLISIIVAIVVVLSYYAYCALASKIYFERYRYLAKFAFVSTLKWDAIEEQKKLNETLLEDIQVFEVHQRVVVLVGKEGYHAGDEGEIVRIKGLDEILVRMDYGQMVISYRRKELSFLPTAPGRLGR